MLLLSSYCYCYCCLLVVIVLIVTVTRLCVFIVIMVIAVGRTGSFLKQARQDLQGDPSNPLILPTYP